MARREKEGSIFLTLRSERDRNWGRSWRRGATGTPLVENLLAVQTVCSEALIDCRESGFVAGRKSAVR